MGVTNFGRRCVTALNPFASLLVALLGYPPEEPSWTPIGFLQNFVWNMSLHKVFGTLLCAALGASLLAGVATPARADREDACRRQGRKADDNLEKAVRRHGEHSRQAEQRRWQMEETRECCRMRDQDCDRDQRRSFPPPLPGGPG